MLFIMKESVLSKKEKHAHKIGFPSLKLPTGTKPDPLNIISDDFGI